jgi:hypothetical protein
MQPSSIYSGPILRAVDAIVAATEGLATAQLDWRPAPDANSLTVLATHTMGNLRETVLGLLGGEQAQPFERRRDAEFAVAALTPGDIAREWSGLRVLLEAVFANLSTAGLDRHYAHPRRGPLTGHELCLVVLRHMAEHRGHAELTQQLLLAKPKS